MQSKDRSNAPVLPRAAIVSLCAALLPLPVSAGYFQQNLVSDIPGLAQNTDANLKNPWGISFSATSPFWVSNNHTGTSTLYNSSGTPQALVVSVPPQSAGTGSPTGQVFNVNNANASVFSGDRFIFATEDGTISGWQNVPTGNTSAAIRKDNFASGAVYKGLAIDSSANTLYATNFSGTGKIDSYDSSYNLITPASRFTDPNLPAGYAPFNIQNIGGVLYVAYAFKASSTDTDETAGPGLGLVDKYDLNGNLLNRLITGGPLDAPWGFALAPSNFGQYSNDLLVGNFGDGKINAFNPVSGNYLGTLTDSSGKDIVIEGLWGLTFGNGGSGGVTNKLYFAAGISDGAPLNIEQHGLFGSLSVVPEPDSLTLFGIGLLGFVFGKRRAILKG